MSSKNQQPQQPDFGRTVHFHIPQTGEITFCFSCKKTYGRYNGYCKECGYCECHVIKITLPSIKREKEGDQKK